MGVGGAKNVDLVGEKAVERTTPKEGIASQARRGESPPAALYVHVLHKYITYSFGSCHLELNNHLMGFLGGM